MSAAGVKAISREVCDARGRAEAVATATGIKLGSADAVELNPGFPERQPCRRSRRTKELRCVAPPFSSSSATVTFEIAGGASSDEGARELSVSATGFAPVDAKRRISPAIRHALFAARLAATPDAAKAARANVEVAAQGSGLVLGQPFSIVEQASPYGNILVGAFAPGIAAARLPAESSGATRRPGRAGWLAGGACGAATRRERSR